MTRGCGWADRRHITSQRRHYWTGPRAPSSMESFLYINLFVFAYDYFNFFSSTASTHPSLAQRGTPTEPTRHPNQNRSICVLRAVVQRNGLFHVLCPRRGRYCPIEIVYSRTLRSYISVLLHLDVTRSGASNSDQITQTHSH